MDFQDKSILITGASGEPSSAVSPSLAASLAFALSLSALLFLSFSFSSPVPGGL